MKWSSLQIRVSKFTPKKFYRIGSSLLYMSISDKKERPGAYTTNILLVVNYSYVS